MRIFLVFLDDLRLLVRREVGGGLVLDTTASRKLRGFLEAKVPKVCFYVSFDCDFHRDFQHRVITYRNLLSCRSFGPCDDVHHHHLHHQERRGEERGGKQSNGPSPSQSIPLPVHPPPSPSPRSESAGGQVSGKEWCWSAPSWKSESP